MKRLLPLLALVAAPLVMAHPGHAETTTFFAGFLHPLSGFDHLLAMLAVGLWSASNALTAKHPSPPPSRGRDRERGELDSTWAAPPLPHPLPQGEREFFSSLLLPMVFVAFLLFGIALSNFTALPAVEPMIAVSLLVLGLAAGIGKQIPQTAALAIVGLFAIFHGYAHGAELGASVAAVAGILFSTMLLHLAGIALGLNTIVRRAAAAIVAGGGIFLLLQLT